MKKILLSLGVGLCTVLALSSTALAMAGMYTAKYVDGSNVIIMADNVHNTQADVPVTYNLRVYDLDGKPIYFGNVQMDVVHKNKTFQQINLRRTKNEDAVTKLTFPSKGTFILKVRFMDNDKQIAKGEFPIVVGDSPNQSWFVKIASWQTAVGFILGLGAATVVKRDLKRRLSALIKAKKSKKSKSKE